jgi:hypothetical protein
LWVGSAGSGTAVGLVDVDDESGEEGLAVEAEGDECWAGEEVVYEGIVVEEDGCPIT